MTQALLVIDYINGIAKTGVCVSYLNDHPEVLANTNRLIRAFRAKSLPIIFIRLAFDANYAGLPQYAPPAEYMKKHKLFQLGSEDVQFIDELDYNAEDIVVNKTYGNPFFGNDLEKQLTALGAQELIFTGIATNNAILFGANAAIEKNFKVTLVHDACGAQTDADHEAALAIIKNRAANEIVDARTLLGSI
jgi:ureidoacrylate peracid hydrolase